MLDSSGHITGQCGRLLCVIVLASANSVYRDHQAIHANRAGDTAEHACLYEPSSFYLPESWCSTLFNSDCGVVPIWTSCAITRCREIMTPQLSIMKTRFAKASLRARCARHRSWRATCRLPNRRAGTLSFPIVALDTQLPYCCVGRPSAIPTGRFLSNPSLRDASTSAQRSSPHISVLVAIYTIYGRRSR